LLENPGSKSASSVLADELSHLIQTDTIYDPARFASVDLSEESKALLAKPSQHVPLAHLNRLLLEDAYPDALARGIKWAVAWPWWNDALMGCFLILNTLSRCHINLTGCIKRIGAIRFVYSIEGVTFVVLAFLLVARAGLAGLILAAIIANLIWSGAWGIRSTAHYFEASARQVAWDWILPAIRYVFLLSPLSAALWRATFHLRPFPRLLVDSAAMLALGLPLLWFIGLTKPVREELRTALKRLAAR
jgi:hypothetical protein